MARRRLCWQPHHGPPPRRSMPCQNTGDLVSALGDTELAERGEWFVNGSRVESRVQLGEVLERIFLSQSTEAWLTILEEGRVPCAPILDVAGAFAQEQITQGDFVGDMATPSGETRAMKTPLRIDGRRPAIRRGPRALGEDTEEVLGIS